MFLFYPFIVVIEYNKPVKFNNVLRHILIYKNVFDLMLIIRKHTINTYITYRHHNSSTSK